MRMCVYVCVLRLSKILCVLFVSLLILLPRVCPSMFSASVVSSRVTPAPSPTHTVLHIRQKPIQIQLKRQGVWENSKFGFRSQMRFFACQGRLFTTRRKSPFTAHSLEQKSSHFTDSASHFTRNTEWKAGRVQTSFISEI